MTGVPRTACATCAPGVCVAYSPLSAGRSCLCGHGEDEHLPERGGCTDTHCMRFQTVTYLAGDPGRTPCQRPGCGRPYILHRALDVLVQSPLSRVFTPIMAPVESRPHSTLVTPK
ncbi:hypothetical protein DFH08DRAFT_953239 [Mycena albidolilacea]|uniref:Uncharacterized protein n=1 Tax=Mycena albidolilacea TaxID=1033008 RepID=A0AAD7AGQ1_9AGAR|nr:hypothetical protein DFH08DRAFT_953239 [Mycena albidolilacea]